MAQFLDLFPDSGSKRAATRLVALVVVSAMLGGHMDSGRTATPPVG